MGRTVTALVTCGDEYVGVVGPFPVVVPWWSMVEPVVEHLEAVLGGPVAVLRLVSVEGGDPPRGGHVTYHAEFLGDPRSVTPLSSSVPAHLLDVQAKRSAWATPHGVRDALAWADDALRAAGRPALGPARQVKTWNLAGLFRFPTLDGPVWLKITPEFAADEGSVMAAFAEADPAIVPTVLAADPANRRVLLDHVPGDDCWTTTPEVIRTTITRYVAAQATVTPPTALPRRTPEVLAERVDAVIGRADLTPEERDQARRLVRTLPAMVAELNACGLPETVVHGDFHTGNWRSTGGTAVILDFSDAHVGHPVLDGLRTRMVMSEADQHLSTRTWIDAWHEHSPGSDPARALELAEPYQHLFYAVRYQEFLDGIEPSEHVYHYGDPASELREALRAARQ
ncbi:phosphotransferase family protein [Nonomuraea maritima]|uniref:phosphotransferase family protein n=1 Tax=Nonomuraea maritima TaxID=683260 RepID=UPI001FDEDCC5|nr:aminoglycoside phosphotransferase family protein [Nonomuraea maritima]